MRSCRASGPSIVPPDYPMAAPELGGPRRLTDRRATPFAGALAHRPRQGGTTVACGRLRRSTTAPVARLSTQTSGRCRARRSAAGRRANHCRFRPGSRRAASRTKRTEVVQGNSDGGDGSGACSSRTAIVRQRPRTALARRPTQQRGASPPDASHQAKGTARPTTAAPIGRVSSAWKPLSTSVSARGGRPNPPAASSRRRARCL